MLKRILSVAAAMTVASLVQAAAITGSAADYPNYTVLNLSPASDWVIYGGNTPTDMTTGLAASSFSPVTLVAGAGPFTAGLSGGVKFAHDAGYGAFPAATAEFDGSPVVADSGATQATLSFTHTLIGPTETLKILVMTKSSDQLWYDASASIGTDTWSVVNQPISAGPKTQLSLVTLNISGAKDDVLTFSMKSDFSNNINPAPAGWWGVGIAGATVTAVPEPASLALLGLGGLMLGSRRRRTA